MNFGFFIAMCFLVMIIFVAFIEDVIGEEWLE
jgi:hypothetical protein